MPMYEKELIINGEVVRSPEQQVYENMKNIKKLQEVIKPEYKTSEALTSSSVSVAIADTNAPEGTTEGWLITEDGLKFKITGGDDTNLLLEFYADLKGPQGEEGPGGDPTTLIDDNSVSESKTWSSDKINTEIASAGKQLYLHSMWLKRSNPNIRVALIVINDSNEAFTISSLKTYLYSNNLVGDYLDNLYMASGSYSYSGSYYVVCGICKNAGGTGLLIRLNNGSGDELTISDYTLTDHIIAL